MQLDSSTSTTNRSPNAEPVRIEVHPNGALVDSLGGVLPPAMGIQHRVLRQPRFPAIGELSPGMTVLWWEHRPVGHFVVGRNGMSVCRDCVDPSVLDRIATEGPDERRPDLSASVVICTRDRPEALQRCLRSIQEQTYAPSEIIVVDNASCDERTREVALAAGAIYVREDRLGLDSARNAGARRATAEIVAYADDDVLLHPRWLERLVAAFDRRQIAAVMGLVLPAELETEAQWHFQTHWRLSQGYERQDYDKERVEAHDDSVFPAWDLGAGASMAIRRDVFRDVGHFDERLDVERGECSGPSEFWYRLVARGFVCRYEPSSVAFHFHRRTMEDLSHQIFQYTRGHTAALLVQYERTGNATNRKRAFVRMPRWYASRLWRLARGDGTPRDRFLKTEISGYASGVLFYYRHRQKGHPSP